MMFIGDQSAFSFSLQHHLNRPEKVLQMQITIPQIMKNWDEEKEFICHTAVTAAMKTLIITYPECVRIKVCIYYKTF